MSPKVAMVSAKKNQHHYPDEFQPILGLHRIAKHDRKPANRNKTVQVFVDSGYPICWGLDKFKGDSGNGHCSGKAAVYFDVGESLGDAMLGHLNHNHSIVG